MTVLVFMMDKFSIRKQSESVPLQEPTQMFSHTVIETASKETIKKQICTTFTVDGKSNML
jgi:hypothetical protein